MLESHTLEQFNKQRSSDLRDAANFMQDNNVDSIQEDVQQMMEGQDFQMEDSDDLDDLDDLDDSDDSDDQKELVEDPADCLGKFKCPHGLVRDARIILSKLRSLYINSDNIHRFLQGFETPNATLAFVQNVRMALSGKCVLLENEAVLDQIEMQWTGNSRKTTQQTCLILAQFDFRYYIDHSWNQVRELTYLAVSVEAWGILTGFENISESLARLTCNQPLELSGGEVLNAINKLLQQGVRQDLINALARRTYMAEIESRPAVINPDGETPQTFSSPKMRIRQYREEGSSGLAMQRIVHEVDEKHCRGHHDSSEFFLRISSRIDIYDRPLWRGWRAGDQLLTGDCHYDKILVYADVLNGPDAKRKLCLYILDGKTEQVNPFSVVTKLLFFLHKDFIYRTVRNGRFDKMSSCWQNNLIHFYQMDMGNTEHQFKNYQDGPRLKILEWIKAIDIPQASWPCKVM
jgi:hypothetical protein